MVNYFLQKYQEILDSKDKTNILYIKTKKMGILKDLYFNRSKFDNIKDSSQSLKNSLVFSKEQTKSREIENKRYDIYGNLITNGGKQKISFIDKVSNVNFVEVIKVESFKEYNKMEEICPNKGNGCCLII